MKTYRMILFCLLALTFSASTLGQGSGETLIRNATIMTASHGTIENGSILINNGKIVAVGKNNEVIGLTEDQF